MINYGKILRHHRELAGYNQAELARAIGISQQNINRWERNEVIPNLDFCLRLASFYGISLDDLVGFPDYDESTNITTVVSKQQPALSVFNNEYIDIINDNNFIQTAKLYKAITPELRALALGYLVGLLQNNGVNTKSILGY